jgi:hypothetical protein
MILNQNVRSRACKVHLGVKYTLMRVSIGSCIKRSFFFYLKRILDEILARKRVFLGAKHLVVVIMVHLLFVVSPQCRLGGSMLLFSLTIPFI